MPLACAAEVVYSGAVPPPIPDERGFHGWVTLAQVTALAGAAGPPLRMWKQVFRPPEAEVVQAKVEAAPVADLAPPLRLGLWVMVCIIVVLFANARAPSQPLAEPPAPAPPATERDGATEFQSGDLAAAREALLQALRVPGSADAAVLLLAEVLIAERRLDEAELLLQRVLLQAPRSDAELLLAEVRRQLGR
jgi:tetratricopeptide (TPR) repeat protein